MAEAPENTLVPTKEKNFAKRVIIVLLFLAIVTIIVFINTKGAILQMQEMGEKYLQAYMENARYSGFTFLVIFSILFFAFLFTTLLIKKGLKKFFESEKKVLPKLPNKSISLIISVIIGLIVAPIISEKFMLAVNPGYFGTDPIFNTDIGYYIFQKPFLEFIIFSLMVLTLVILVYTLLYYIIVFNMCFDGIDIEMLKKSMLIKQIGIVVGVLSILIASLVIVKTPDILFSNLLSNEVESDLTVRGAGIVDVTIKLWGYRILAIVIIISVYLTIYYTLKQNKKRAIIAILLVPMYLLILFIISILYDVIFVRSNEFDKEKQYIAYNIANTKRAYNIEIEEEEVNYSGTLTLAEVNNNPDIVNNIPIVDESVTLSTLKEYQSNVGFYAFNNIHMSQYNGVLQYITPREILTSAGISNSSKIYEYTHGYSVIITSAVETDEYGNIKYLQSDFDDSKNVVNISEPRIYFGLETKNDVIVNNSSNTEYDYPLTTTTNTTNSYNGKGGLSLNFWNRLILGLSRGNMNIALGIDMNENSKILTNRQIRDRVKKVLPEILYDENPYLVITEAGRLVWVIDGYTVTNQYPYSTEITIEYEGIKRNINYIRNSVKVLVDAYDGTIDFYVTDRDDPIIMAYNKIHPGLLLVEENIPEDIQKHLIYPKFLYDVQSKLLTSYHDIQPEVLYRNDDIWKVATYYSTAGTTGKATKMDSHYIMVEEAGVRMGLVLPYSEYNKNNIKAYLVGTYNDGRSMLKLYKFNSNSSVLGPIQLESQIEEDETIATELKAISVTGTRLLKNILVIPVENTLLYVEPIYQVRLNETQIPTLKKIIVASGNKLAIGDNMKEALDNLLSQYAVSIEVDNSENLDGLIEQIIKANNNLKESSINTDWELMGKDITRLQQLITQLEQLKNKEEREAEDSISGEKEAESPEIMNTIEDDNILEVR